MLTWLGTPQSGDTKEDVLDPYTTKIGGSAAVFRCSRDGDVTAFFRCPKCSTVDHVSLLGQLYAPLDFYDRVLYLLTCAACTNGSNNKTGVTSGVLGDVCGASCSKHLRQADDSKSMGRACSAASLTSYCFALRSQNFNKAYYEQLQARRRQEDELRRSALQCRNAPQKLLFDENADWGEDAVDGSGDATAMVLDVLPGEEELLTDTAEAERPNCEYEKSFSVAPRGTLVPLKGRTYTKGIALDLFQEPERKTTLDTTEDQLREAYMKYGEGAVLDTTSVEEDDESRLDKCVRKYMERIEMVPSQCVRWCPGSEPLRTSIEPIVVPPCPLCNAPRRFEAQLTSPSIYFLTRDIGESGNAFLHFSNVLIYTCSNNCYTELDAYAPEVVVVEAEI